MSIVLKQIFGISVRTFPLIIVMWAASPFLVQASEEPVPLLLTDHVLAEKIWDVKGQRFVDKQQLTAQVFENDYVLLGETHDNPVHHKHQAWVIDTLSTKLPTASVAFEMISNIQGEAIAKEKFSSSDELISILNQYEAGWEYEQNYKPVFDSVIKAGYSMHPANFDRSTLFDIVKKGEEKAPQAIRAVLNKNRVDEKHKAVIAKEIEEAHCGMANIKMVNAMLLGQRVRDAVMSLALVNNRNNQSAVLIAGSGHVRNDRGVPVYLQNEDKSASILAIGFMEVHEEADTVDAYAEYWKSDQLPFDYVWFTARVDRPDPCEEMKRHMQKKNDKPEVSSRLD